MPTPSQPTPSQQLPPPTVPTAPAAPLPVIAGGGIGPAGLPDRAVAGAALLHLAFLSSLAAAQHVRADSPAGRAVDALFLLSAAGILANLVALARLARRRTPEGGTPPRRRLYRAAFALSLGAALLFACWVGLVELIAMP